MGRGGQTNCGATLLYGPPQRRSRTTEDDAASANADDERWRVGDRASWYPNWSPGPVDVVIDSFPAYSTGHANVEITTPDIEETGQIWAARLSELDPV